MTLPVVTFTKYSVLTEQSVVAAVVGTADAVVVVGFVVSAVSGAILVVGGSARVVAPAVARVAVVELVLGMAVDDNPQSP